MDDISKKLQKKVLQKKTPSQNFELCDKESIEILKLNPEFAIFYFVKSFQRKNCAK